MTKRRAYGAAGCLQIDAPMPRGQCTGPASGQRPLVPKRQFGHVKVRYRGLAKSTAWLQTLLALENM